jgi:hypothetical protein
MAQAPPQTPRLLKLAEAARILGVSVWTLRHSLIGGGHIALIDIGAAGRANPRVAQDDLEAFINSRRRRATK